MTRLIGHGSPEPLGVTPVEGPGTTTALRGVNVAVHAPNAEAIEFCLFDATGNVEIDAIRLPARTGDVVHGFIADVGPGDRYGLRAFGPFAPNSGHRYNPSKLLVDPFATRLDRRFSLDPALFDQRIHGRDRDDIDSAFVVPKAIVEAPVVAPPRKPLRNWRDLVIYELHVKGFTAQHPEIPPDIRGTFAGLAHPAAIRHLVDLGITAVELMPVAASLDERHLPPLGLTNYWGYNPITHMAPDPRLAPGGWDEIAATVEALHAAGIAVLLDAVLNHTGEGDHLGPTVSMRGLDNATWYRLNDADRSRYIDDAGCGNALAAERPVAVRLMLDVLRHWEMRAGLDGFRFDLATTLARGPNGFDPNHPFLLAISQDPHLRDLILIAEPWDIGLGGYQLGNFPPLWGEWNDRSRDVIRRFWRGDGRLIGDFTTIFAGSADVFAGRRRPLSRGINFVTAHDGFTLNDLVSYGHKHNEANGENNRDGTDGNNSWNHGIEGPTDNPAIIAARKRDIRGILATLILSRGTPMLTMGDELGRTQSGNNNAYAQDNPLSWIDWTHADKDLAAYVARLIRLRRQHPALSAETRLTGLPIEPGGAPDVVWLSASGQPMGPDDWNSGVNRFFAGLYAEGRTGRVLVAINVDWQDLSFMPPEPGDGLGWFIDLDSAAPERSGPIGFDVYAVVMARSVLVLREALHAGHVRKMSTSEDPTLLDTLAEAAGIQRDWWDISGKHVFVSGETKRAILRSMGYAVETAADLKASLQILTQERFGRPLPQTIVAREHQPVIVTLGGLLARASTKISLFLKREDGSTDLIEVHSRSGTDQSLTGPDGSLQQVRRISLPTQPLGRHRISLTDQPDVVCDLIVAPATCYLPDKLARGERVLGVAAHLYTLRRSGDQGIGDFTTLSRLSELASGQGAEILGLNPLHAMFPGDRDRVSPYHASDRRFIDPIYIDVTQLPVPLRGDAVRAAIWSETRATAALTALPDVDYARVWQSKKKVLDLAFKSFERMLAGPAATPLAQDFDAFVDSRGLELQRFAEFHAIAEEIGQTQWRDWPTDVRTIIRRDRLEIAMRYQMFLQWLADRQLAEAARAAAVAGLKLGFYRDLAVGSAPDGAESWGDRQRLLIGHSVGAPPDPFSAAGQVWNLPPPNPRFMAEGGYAGFASLIASNMAHAGALRIDHAMGLRRLFVVPDGMTGADGAYVDMPFDDLLGVLALESHRARCAVVGEDLGTVPEGFREKLTASNVLAYRVLWFEREGTGFKPPRLYPAQAAACVSTHDLATLNGWWQGADIAENAALGLLDAGAAEAQLTVRREEKSRLADLVMSEAQLSARPDLDAPLDDATSIAIHGLVAASPALLALAQADELTAETRAVNLPGTDRERPNWRRKLGPDIEQLFASPIATGIMSAMKARR